MIIDQFMFIQALECRANDDVADILSEHTAYVQWVLIGVDGEPTLYYMYLQLQKCSCSQATVFLDLNITCKH